ncbi:hypothetical protein C0J52_26851, partial [Blattella germanica]
DTQVRVTINNSEKLLLNPLETRSAHEYKQLFPVHEQLLPFIDNQTSLLKKIIVMDQVTTEDWKGFYNHVEKNWKKNYLERDSIIPHVVDQIVIKMNGESGNGITRSESSEESDLSLETHTKDDLLCAMNFLRVKTFKYISSRLNMFTPNKKNNKERHDNIFDL